MTFRPRLLVALFFTAIFVWVVSDAYFGFGERSSRSALFPLAIGVPALALALITTAAEVRRVRAQVRQSTDAEITEDVGELTEAAVARRRTIAIIGWIVGVYLAIWAFGFILTAPIVTLAYIRFAGREPWITAIAGGLVSWLFFDGLFQCTLDIPLMERMGGRLMVLIEEGIGTEINTHLLVPFLC